MGHGVTAIATAGSLLQINLGLINLDRLIAVPLAASFRWHLCGGLHTRDTSQVLLVRTLHLGRTHFPQFPTLLSSKPTLLILQQGWAGKDGD